MLSLKLADAFVRLLRSLENETMAKRTKSQGRHYVSPQWGVSSFFVQLPCRFYLMPFLFLHNAITRWASYTWLIADQNPTDQRRKWKLMHAKLLRDVYDTTTTIQRATLFNCKRLFSIQILLCTWTNSSHSSSLTLLQTLQVLTLVCVGEVWSCYAFDLAKKLVCIMDPTARHPIDDTRVHTHLDACKKLCPHLVYCMRKVTGDNNLGGDAWTPTIMLGRGNATSV